jgi:hypothetical protein
MDVQEDYGGPAFPQTKVANLRLASDAVGLTCPLGLAYVLFLHATIHWDCRIEKCWRPLLQLLRRWCTNHLVWCIKITMENGRLPMVGIVPYAPLAMTQEVLDNGRTRTVRSASRHSTKNTPSPHLIMVDAAHHNIMVDATSYGLLSHPWNRHC